jgi:hypothetical protein
MIPYEAAPPSEDIQIHSHRRGSGGTYTIRREFRGVEVIRQGYITLFRTRLHRSNGSDDTTAATFTAYSDQRCVSHS